MSIFASQTQATLPIPFDAPHTITIRKLTGKEVQQAQADDARGMVNGGARTWAERLKRMVATADPKAMEAVRDPLIGYDRFSVIRAGLLAWSYPESITPTETRDAITDLDDEAADFIATEILKLTKPALFLATAEAVKDDQKNG